MFCKKALILTAFLLLMVSTLMAATTPNSSITLQKMNQIPLTFTKNMGQWDDRVLFRANAGGATMWFTKEGVTYQFVRTISRRGDPMGRPDPIHPKMGDSPSRPYDSNTRDSVDQLVLTAQFLGANPNREVIAEGQLEYKCNYFLGDDPAKWETDVPNYESITIKDLYPGIALKYSGDGNGQAAFELIAAPGADIAQIKVQYDGAEETSLDADGRLVLQTKWGDMTAGLESPANGVLTGSCAWWTSSSTTSQQDLAHGDVRQARAGNSGTLTLSYSTYLGGGSNDYGYGIAVDGSGNAYVTGYTYSTDFPTLNPYQIVQSGQDAFVTKLSSSGNTLIYSTYLGGSGDDWTEDIAIDGSGNAYVVGVTYSSNLPTLNPYQSDQGGGGDAFVTKLSTSGNSLINSTYLGGGGDDYGNGIEVDSSGSAYVTGSTASSNFPTLNPYQGTFQGGAYDAFVTKFSNSGNSLIYSTYLGGGDYDGGGDIAVDGGGNTYMIGGTHSSNFPTLNPYQTDQGGWDVFVTKLSSYGDSLIYSTYLGGGDDEFGYGITVDGSDNAYVTGVTWSSNFPTLNPYQTDQGDRDAFVTKLSSSGSSLVYSTYLGGGSYDYGYGIAVDGSDNAYVTGWTSSSDFPTLNPYQADQGDRDVFVTKLFTSGNSLIFSTYLGGGSEDYGWGIAVDGSGDAYVAGYTASSNFTILNPYQTDQGDWDAFATKLNWTPDYICGDADGEGAINIADAVFLVEYIFSGGAAPNPLAAGDADCSGDINIADCVYLIAYIFSGGPAPCAGCQ